MTTRPPAASGVLRIVVLTAAVGAGHDGPAREIARKLAETGHRAEIVDLVAVAPARTGLLLRALFRGLLRVAPTWWGRIFTSLDTAGRRPRGVSAATRVLTGPVQRILRGRPGGVGRADVVVSTFPLGGHVVAAVRGRGLDVPLITYITDPAVHRSWITPGTDLYLATWTVTASEVWRFGPAPVSIVGPAVRAGFTPAIDEADRAACRTALELPVGPLALVMSGSWGAGDIAAAAADLIRHTPLTPVVVCGRNTRLRHRLAGTPGLVVLGWVRDMPTLMRACDIAVLNSGGLTLAEAAASDLPVIHYRPLPGQGMANAAVAARAGLARYPRGAADLALAARATGAAGRPSATRRTSTGPPGGLIEEIITVAARRQAPNRDQAAVVADATLETARGGTAA